MRVAVVIPAHNEEGALSDVLAAVPPNLVEEIVVVDNASVDRTAEVARARGATVVAEPHLGYGAACLRGIDHLMDRPPEVLVFLDGDGSDDPAEIGRLVEPIERGTADLVIGSRTLGAREAGALLPQARAGNWLATRLIRLFYGGRFTDLGPFRAIRFQSLLDLAMRDRDFGWTVEMQIKASKRRLRCTEIPVSYRRRRAGVSKITGTLAGSIRAGRKILWTVVRNLP